MVRFIFVIIIGILFGIGSVLLIRNNPSFFETKSSANEPQADSKNKVIGFLMYSLLERARVDYSKEITTLSYFSLTLDPDGTIRRQTNPGENEPGWNALLSGKVSPFLQNAKNNNVGLSLVVFNGNSDEIDLMMQDPAVHATNLIQEVIPVMNKYGFSDLNIDIESTKEASVGARIQFLTFIKTVKEELTKIPGKTLTIDVTGLDLIKDTTLINVREAAKIADDVVIMAYDFHSPSSQVTGPVAPLKGAGIMSEFDTEAVIQKALIVIPKEKIILGVPLYGYEWETLDKLPRSAIIPHSGNTASNRRAEKLLSDCATCSAKFDEIDKEAYVIYHTPETQTYHQLFFPTLKSMQEKITFAESNHLGGVALWALGYEGDTLLDPLPHYLSAE